MTLSRYEHTGAAPATTLSGNIGAADSSFMVSNGTGYPTGAVGLFVICIDALQSNEEKILCSARSGTTFTVAPGGRGYDNTVASSHTGGSAAVTHVLAAAELDDDNSHIYDITRDDHTQYARTDGTREFTGPISVASGTSTFPTVTVSGTAQGATVVATGQARATNFKPNGITGATAASRYVGATTSGAPTSGTFALGDFVIDETGTVWICTTAGTVGSGAVFSLVSADSLTLLGFTTGSPPATTTAFSFQAGVSTVTADGSGTGTVTFPTSFVNNCLVAVANTGSGGGAYWIAETVNYTKTNFQVEVITAAGTPHSGSVTVNWIAIGW